ncbi:MAG: hypothetical protein QE271_13945 [Bacteriovoracaceae bacterium]|nr:hypothetical protein [Bacteriovoracaceae bacterium]
MHVRKYEADSMDEVLKAIKLELGPDAIILKTEEFKGIKGAFKGRKFEITAAISEEDYEKKKKLDSLLNQDQKTKLYQSSSKNIESTLNSYGKLGINKTPKQMVNRIGEGRTEELRSPAQSASLQNSADLNEELENFLSQSEVVRGKKVNERSERTEIPQIQSPSLSSEREWSGMNTMNSPELQNLQKRYSGQQNEIEDLRRKLHELSLMIQENREEQRNSNSEQEEFVLSDKIKSLQHNLKVFDFSYPLINDLCKKVEYEFDNLASIDEDQIYDLVMKELEKKIVCRPLNFQIRNGSNQTESGANITIFISEYSSGQSSLIYKLSSMANRPTILRLESEESFDSHDSLASKLLRADIKSYKKITELITSLRDLTKSDASGDIFIDLKVPQDRPEEVINLIQSLRRSHQKIEVVLVLSALHQEIIGKKMMQRYRPWIDGVAITHTDSSMGLGNLYSTIVQYDRPLFVLSTGRKIPQDWKAADPNFLVKKIFGLNEMNS